MGASDLPTWLLGPSVEPGEPWKSDACVSNKTNICPEEHECFMETATLGGLEPNKCSANTVIKENDTGVCICTYVCVCKRETETCGCTGQPSHRITEFERPTPIVQIGD